MIVDEKDGRWTARSRTRNQLTVGAIVFVAVSCSVTTSLIWIRNAQLPPTIRYTCDRAAGTCYDAYRPGEPEFAIRALEHLVVERRGDGAVLGVRDSRGRLSAWTGRVWSGAVASLETQTQALRDFAKSSEPNISVVLPRGEPMPSRGVLVLVTAFGALLLWGCRRIALSIDVDVDRARGVVEVKRRTLFGVKATALPFGRIRGIHTMHTRVVEYRRRTLVTLLDSDGPALVIFESVADEEMKNDARQLADKLGAVLNVPVEGS